MTSSILSATVASVSFGNLQIEGLLIENGEFAVALQQVATLFQLLPNHAQKWLERKLGEGCSFCQIKTNRESVENKRVRSSENALSLTQFEKLLRKLDREGNEIARSMVDDLIGLSLQQLFSDAFNIKFDKEERQLWLKHRQKHKEQFHPLLTHWLKQDANGDSSLVQWGVEVNEFKRAAKLPVKPIDEYSEGELDNLNRAEVAYNALRKFGVTHKQAVASLS